MIIKVKENKEKPVWQIEYERVKRHRFRARMEYLKNLREKWEAGNTKPKKGD